MPNARPGSIDDGERVGRRLLPRRADPQRPDAHRPVERAPAVLPARLDVGRRSHAENRPDTLLAGAVGVRGQLDRAVALDLLEAAREELDERRARLLALCRAEPRPRRALSGMRSSACRRSPRPACSVVVGRRLELLEQPALLVREPARHDDVHEHAVVAAAEALEDRHALAAQDVHLAGLRARLDLELDGAVERLDRRPSCRAPPRRTSGRPARRCRCPRARSAGRADAHEHVDVARAAAERACVALAA